MTPRAWASVLLLAGIFWASVIVALWLILAPKVGGVEAWHDSALPASAFVSVKAYNDSAGTSSLTTPDARLASPEAGVFVSEGLADAATADDAQAFLGYDALGRRVPDMAEPPSVGIRPRDVPEEDAQGQPAGLAMAGWAYPRWFRSVPSLRQPGVCTTGASLPSYPLGEHAGYGREGSLDADQPSRGPQPEGQVLGQPSSSNAGLLPGRSASVAPSLGISGGSSHDRSNSSSQELSVTGVASFYVYLPGQAAAGPALRTALGPHWRGQVVRVCIAGALNALEHCPTVALTDSCQCLGTRLIDLDVRDFAKFADPSVGLLEVTIR